MLNRIKLSLPHRFYWSVLIILLSVIGIIIVLYSTVWGAALSDDSYYYICSARNLLVGRGFDLVSNFPPLLPLMLSLIELFKIDPLTSIRWLNAILFALNIYLVARIVYALTKSYAFSLLGALFTLISSTLIMVHSWAMSEALYTSLTLSGILIYSAAHEKRSWGIPLFTGLFFGLAAVTRYIGVSLLLAGGILWLIEAGKSIQIRIRNVFIFSILGVFPLLLWMIRNEVVTGQPTNRVFALHLMPASIWINMLNTILLWIIPGRIVNGKELIWSGIIILVLVIWLGVNILRNRSSFAVQNKTDNQRRPITLISLCILAYMVALIISRSFFDIRIPMDERLLSPVLVMGLILLVWIFASGWNNKKWLEYTSIVLFSLVFIITNLARSAPMVQSYHEVGRGYASARDHISETYAYLRNRPNTPIFSNAFTAIYFWTDRVTNPIPSPNEIPGMKADMHQTGAYLVIFDSIPVELYGTTREELTQGLVEQIRLSEATIYRSP
jgi:hypothetical protein